MIAMKNSRFRILRIAALGLAAAFAPPAGAQHGEEAEAQPEKEARLLTGARQLTFEGRRAGEGYFNQDGSLMIFQSERDPKNPFYQIHLMDMETGDVHRVSPGTGKTTCAWIHPSNEKVLFASTHEDPEAKKKQEEELEFRASGQERRYSWDYDPHYDIFEATLDGEHLKNLTDTHGYDAEGSYSPDGEWIVFASNRHAYSQDLSEEDAAIFEKDKSYMMDLYRMRADGSDVERLTTAKGYDGGPFFSPDGERIVWRRFSETGATAEVYTMNVDGTDQKRLTELEAMSWAPFYHPSGDYIIFTTNRHGFSNFELYLVDTAGEKEPVRVTYTPGFDGLPVFHPSGEKLAWTSNRTPKEQSQIFLANWNDEKARELLGFSEEEPEPSLENAPGVQTTRGGITVDDMRTHIEYLASEEMQGRRTGTPGNRLATAYAASIFEGLGLEPAGDGGSYFQSFEFTAGVSLGENNELTLTNTKASETETFAPDKDWRPLAYSRTGAIDPAEVVFAGYGIQAPGTDNLDEYDSFVHLDVADKWVLVFRYMPEDIGSDLRQHLNTHSSLRYKAMTVRELGAKGLIVVSGPNSQVNDELVDLTFDTSLGESSVAAISVTDAVAQQMLDYAGRDLKALQDKLDTGDPMMGFPLPGMTVSASIAIEQQRETGRNVLARLEAGEGGPPDTAVAIGAHIDHLGVGPSMSSLIRKEDKDSIHYGADDNASGVAGLLEIAQYLGDLKQQGKLELEHDVLFAAWSGEELGLLGSKHFTDALSDTTGESDLSSAIPVYLNMDMIGRLDEKLILQGVGSSSIWKREIERRNVPVGLPITTQNEPYLPTDAMEFYLHGVPFLNAFTGAHADYHTPRDTADKIHYEGAAKTARLMGLIARSLATSAETPDYQEWEKPGEMDTRANLRAYLGTIPDYAAEDVTGVKLAGVTNGAPADEAGLQEGDVVVELAGQTIENIYDYTYAIEALKVDKEVTIKVNRGGETLTLNITPGSRD